MAQAIQAAQATSLPVSLSVSLHGNAIDIMVGESPPTMGTLWIMGFAREVHVKIERGENSGKTIVYHNAVRKIVPAGSWAGGAKTFSVARPAVMGADCTGCVAVLQQGHVGRVLGLSGITVS